MHMNTLFIDYSTTLEVVSSGGSPTLRKLAKAVLPVLLAALAGGCGHDVDARIRALYNEQRRIDDRSKGRIEAALGDPDRDVRATALVVMRGIDAERAAKMADRALDDTDALVRGAAVRVLGDRIDPANPDPGLAKRLAREAAGDPAWQVRAAALDALAGVDDPAAVEAFGRALDDSVRHVRRIALEVAARRQGLGQVERIGRLASADPDWENRVLAAEALGSVTEAQAYEGLDAARHDPNEFVRAAAARSLREIERAGVARPAPEAPPPAPATPKPRPAAAAPKRSGAGTPAPVPPAPTSPIPPPSGESGRPVYSAASAADRGRAPSYRASTRGAARQTGDFSS
jgi:hypothetical protein